MSVAAATIDEPAPAPVAPPMASAPVSGAATTSPATAEIVLRVLTGRLAGAEHRVYAGKFVRAGHSFNHDIVLRGSGTAGVSIELHVAGGIATIKVVAGSIMLLGRPLAAGEDAQLPFYVPVMVGEFAVAVGEARAAQWRDADGLSESMVPVLTLDNGVEASREPAPPSASLTMVQRIVTRLYPARRWLDVKPNLPRLGIVAALVVMAFAAIGPIWTWVDDSFGGPRYATQVLAAAGFRGVTVVRDPVTGSLVVQGVVRTDADLARLRELAAASFGAASFTVESTEAHAAAATEILAAQGMDARAKPVAAGVLLIDSEYLAQDRQDSVRQMLKVDLPAVKAIRFAPNAARGQSGLQYFFASGAFGIASVVQGEPSYIVTADGTRWFAGATVPTGHKILAITATSISFEREGRIDELTL